MKSRARIRQRRELVKLSAFLALAGIAIAWLGAVMGSTQTGPSVQYQAVFEGISGLEPGDEVRVAGVTVGEVSEIQVRDDATVLVEFDVDPGNRLNASSEAVVEYKNLVGDRVLRLTRPDPSAAEISPGGTVPASRTQAALQLNTLLEGFQPLFRGLAPQQINQLTKQLIGVLQGQERAVETLVSSVGSVTTTLGNRQELITSVVENLNTVVGTVNARRDNVGNLITQMDELVTGLNRRDEEVLDASQEIDGLARDATGLLRRSRKSITPDLRALGKASGKLNRHSSTLQALLTQLPEHYAQIKNTASYGNFFNFFLCGVQVTLTDPDGNPVQTPPINSDAARCQR